MKKYYTPTRKELYIGFEYEWYHPINKVWCPDMITYSEDISTFNVDTIRAKLLDEEDILDLGFIKGEGLWYNQDEYSIALLNNGINITRTNIAEELGFSYVYRGNPKSKKILEIILETIDSNKFKR